MSVMRLVTAVLLLAGALACGPNGSAGPAGDAARPPATDPYIRGTVESVSAGDQTAGALAVVLVSDDSGGNQAALTVGADTAVWEAFGGGLEPSSAARLGEGQTVSAWVSGPVQESFPVQAVADVIVIHVE